MDIIHIVAGFIAILYKNLTVYVTINITLYLLTITVLVGSTLPQTWQPNKRLVKKFYKWKEIVRGLRRDWFNILVHCIVNV